METEVEKLKSNYNLWEMDIWIIKQHEENIQKALVFLKNSLQATDNRQQKMEGFLVKSSNNPNFIPQFIEQLLEEEEVMRTNGGVNWSTSTMLPFLKPKLLQLKGFRETESPFLRKMYDMVDDPNTNTIISWSPSGTSFFIRDKSKFTGLLLQYFGHDTIKNFTNCLSAYGFKRVDSFLNEYKQEKFQRGQKHMLKHIKKRPSKSDTMKNLLEDMVAEVKRLKDHQNLEINNEISKLKQQEVKTKSCLSSLKECLRHAKCKLIQIKEGSDSKDIKEARPWLDPFKNIDKLKTAMDKMEVDIAKLESNQEFRVNYLTGLEGFFNSTESRQRQMEIYMSKTLSILGFDEDVKKKPREAKRQHDKVTRRRKPFALQGSVEPNYNQNTVEIYQPETSTTLNASDLAWARELEHNINIECREQVSCIHVKEEKSEPYETSCPENSDELNIWARDLEDDLVSTLETTESTNLVKGRNINDKFGSFSTDNFGRPNKSARTVNHVVPSYIVQEHITNETVGRSKVNGEDVDLWVSIHEGGFVFK